MFETVLHKVVFKCPSDGSDLTPYSMHGFEIDVCGKCKGVWYDEDEFAGYLHKLSGWDMPKDHQIILSSQQTVDLKDKREGRRCPRDGTPFLTFQYFVDSGVHIDRCPICSGIWLDGGELHKIVDYRKPDPLMKGVAKVFFEELRAKNKMAEMARSAPFLLLAPLYFVPYADTLRREKFPLINTSIIVTNAIIFLFITFPKGVLERAALNNLYGFVPALVGSWQESYRFLTSAFLHADVFHIVGNMLMLHIFGDNLEERFGKLKYIVFYLFAILASTLFYTLFNLDSTDPGIGASGAVSGVMGAYLVLHPSARLKLFTLNPLMLRFGKFSISTPAWYYLAGWFVLEALHSLFYSNIGVSSGIAFEAHIGGFLGGFVLAMFVVRLKLV